MGKQQQEKATEIAEMSYEQAAAELEIVVNHLENGDMTLEESIIMFERGVSLVRLCNKKLDDIEKRITVMIEGKDGTVEKDFALDG